MPPNGSVSTSTFEDTLSTCRCVRGSIGIMSDQTGAAAIVSTCLVCMIRCDVPEHPLTLNESRKITINFYVLGGYGGFQVLGCYAGDIFQWVIRSRKIFDISQCLTNLDKTARGSIILP